MGLRAGKEEQRCPVPQGEAQSTREEGVAAAAEGPHMCSWDIGTGQVPLSPEHVHMCVL